MALQQVVFETLRKMWGMVQRPVVSLHTHDGMQEDEIRSGACKSLCTRARSTNSYEESPTSPSV